MTNTKAYKFSLGSKLRDKVTGFEGIVIGRADHISGCDTFGLQCQALKDGFPQDAKWFDEPRLELVSENALVVDERTQRTGADSVPPSAAKAAGR